MPRISVIIPSYNHEKYVSGAIQSVLGQTYQDFEIVITDDGSSDRTVDEIKKFKDPRIRLFTFKENTGGPMATKNCVMESRGEYLAMLSSDDLFLPYKLEKQVKFLDENPDIWAVFGYAQIIDEYGNDFTDKKHFYYNIFQQPNRTRFEWLNYFFYNGNCLCHPSVLARRDTYTEIGPPDLRFSQLGDLNRWIKVCLEHEIYVMPENLIKFRVRAEEANASGNRPETNIRVAVELVQILKNYLRIESIGDFRKVFPEALKGGEEIEIKMIPFLIAMIAIEQYDPMHQYFAIDTLYKLFSQNDIVKEIKKKKGLGYIDFVELTGRFDVFNHFPLGVSNVFIDTGNGFNESQCVHQGIIPNQKFSLTFDLSRYSSIKSIRWDPVENRFCQIKIFSISYRDIQEKETYLDLQTITSNGVLLEDGAYVFETFDPIFFLPIEGDFFSLTIQGVWKFSDLVASGKVFGKRINELQKQVSAFNQAINDRDEQNESLQQIIAGLNNQIAAYEQAVSERDERMVEMVAGYEQAVSERDERMAGMVAGYEQAVSERDERMVEMVAGYEQAVSERDERMNELVAERDEQVSAFNQAINDRDKQNESLQQIIAGLNKQIATYEQTIAEKDRVLSSRKAMLKMMLRPKKME